MLRFSLLPSPSALGGAGGGEGADANPTPNPRRKRGLEPVSPPQLPRAPRAPLPGSGSLEPLGIVLAPLVSGPGRGASWRPPCPVSSRPESTRRGVCQLPAASTAVRVPGMNRWLRRGARGGWRSLTQKMKLNPKSRYLMHLVPPLTGMVQARLAWAGPVWNWGRARPGRGFADLGPGLRRQRAGLRAALLKSATPY